MKMTTRKRFFNTKVVHVNEHEPASFWQENAIAIVILHCTTKFSKNVVVVKTSHGNVYFIILLSAGKGLTAFNIKNSANYAHEKQ